MKIDNLWTENLTLANGSFGKVRRFDRCTTCHKGIDKTAPGTADQPAYLEAQTVELTLKSPETEPTADDAGILPGLMDVYGMAVSDYGLIDDNDAAVNLVVPRSLAATASVREAHSDDVGPGVRVGDVIESVNGDKVLSPGDVAQFMLVGIDWGQDIVLKVRRGLPQPFASHPRLDLFVGSLSPHPVARFGCTSCHDGQGSATSFGFASHTPNDPQQAEEWSEELGWFNNHHWIYPMYPERFAESACLKCHHEVTELEASAKFVETPAPLVVEGHELIESYGCYACHEINGYDGPNKRVGPDMRLEPNYYAAALAVEADPGFDKFDEKSQQLTVNVVNHPDENASRNQLRESSAGRCAGRAALTGRLFAQDG